VICHQARANELAIPFALMPQRPDPLVDLDMIANSP
jgi:hypothetical protein